MSGRRDLATRFQPGQSGNLAGRPSMPAEVRAALAEGGAEALGYLRGVVAGKSRGGAAARVAAARAVLVTAARVALVDQQPDQPPGAVYVYPRSEVMAETITALACLMCGFPARPESGAGWRLVEETARVIGWVIDGNLSSAEAVLRVPYDPRTGLPWGFKLDVFGLVDTETGRDDAGAAASEE